MQNIFVGASFTPLFQLALALPLNVWNVMPDLAFVMLDTQYSERHSRLENVL